MDMNAIFTTVKDVVASIDWEKVIATAKEVIEKLIPIITEKVIPAITDLIGKVA